MTRSTNPREPQVVKPHFPLPWLPWIIGGILILICCIGLFSYFRGSILLQQQGVITQSTIVAINPCSLYSTTPNSSSANQGVFLTVLFSDEGGRLHRVILPECLQRIYQPGNTYAIKYVPADPSLVIGATSGNYQSTVPLLLLFFSLIGGGLGLAIVITATIEPVQQIRLYRSLKRNTLRPSTGKKSK